LDALGRPKVFTPRHAAGQEAEMTTRDAVDRRHVLQILTALGFGGGVAAELAAQATPAVAPAALQSAAGLLAGGFDPTRLDVAGRAVRRNLDQLQVVRELELDDAIEPATVFLARP
jgi:hypothetical protein